MARKNFNAGAEVAVGEGNNFKNATEGGHSAVLTGVIHLGNFEDVFTKGGVSETKKPCNFALAVFTLMGKNDLNEDGTRIRAFKPFPIKNGDKAWMTRILDAVDPKEEAAGFDDCIGNILSVQMKGSAEKGEDGLPKYVNFDGVAAENEEMMEIIEARVAAEELAHIGHIEFNNMTAEVMKEIPAQYIRQYFLGQSNGSSMNFKGSKAEEVFLAIRAEDPEYCKKKVADASKAKPQPTSNQAQAEVPAQVPTDIPAPSEIDDEQEY